MRYALCAWRRIRKDMTTGQKVVLKTSYNEIKPYTTKDGAIIRELMHPEVQGNSNQSLAEATIAPGTATALHRHEKTEELYHFTAGKGRVTVGKQAFQVSIGDTVCIPPGTLHSLENSGNEPLKLLCCCAPPYSHDDTELVA
jgi:mannose-6-phosphate isomerase-like protein (cupin superfamily)